MSVGMPVATADSARALAQVYTWSLLATVPLALGWMATFVLARASAGARLLAWRAAIGAAAMIALAQLLPLHWGAAVVPAGFAEPLVALGRMQVAAAGSSWGDAWLPVVLAIVYLAGVGAALRPLARGWRASRRIVRAARPADDARLDALVRECQCTLGISRDVRLVISDVGTIPFATGVLTPVIVLPSPVVDWPDGQLRALLLHELGHVASQDVLARVITRAALALCWFNPLAWVALAESDALSELACDDRVLVAGVKPSEYAALLVRAAASLTEVPASLCPSMALARSGLRERVRAITTPRRTVRTATRLHLCAAAAAALAVAIPLGSMRPAPTRDVLTALMHDTRWDARAYAVVRLAQRADTLAIARAAARHDPSARVRALARSAVAEHERTADLLNDD